MQSTISQQWHGEEVKIMGKKVVGKSAYEIGLVIEGQAKELAPKNFGYLAASITTQSMTEGTSPESPGKYKGPSRGADPGMPPNMQIAKPKDEMEVLVGTPVEYGPHMEFGTIKTDAQPFLRPALDLAKGRVVTIVERDAKMYFKQYLLEHDAYLRSRGIA
jgi:hypothetical protein